MEVHLVGTILRQIEIQNCITVDVCPLAIVGAQIGCVQEWVSDGVGDLLECPSDILVQRVWFAKREEVQQSATQRTLVGYDWVPLGLMGACSKSLGR